jgi:hypothetical protein
VCVGGGLAGFAPRAQNTYCQLVQHVGDLFVFVFDT